MAFCTRIARIALSVAALLALTAPAAAQLPVPTTGASVDFTGWAGTGLDSVPAAGHLDSDAWRIWGTGSTNAPTMTFGGTATTTGFNGGANIGSTTTGNLYNFTGPASNPTLGFRCSSTTFGDTAYAVLKLSNPSAYTYTGLTVSYVVWVRDDASGKAQAFSFSHSTSDSSYTEDYSGAAEASTTAAGSTTWVSTTKTITVTGLSFTSSNNIFLQWKLYVTAGTSGSRDAFALDTISITPRYCGDGTVNGSEECDDGKNGNATDGCTDSCLYSCHADGDCTDAVPGDCTYPTCGTTTTPVGKACNGTANVTNGTACTVPSAGTCSSGTCNTAACTVGAACDDGNPCTFPTTYNASCVCTGTTYSCDDGKACTTDTCNGLGGCSNVVPDGWCLIGGTCYTDGAKNPGNQCQQCLSSTSKTAWVAYSGACDDGNACTKTDTCSGGTCAGTVYSCDDGLACTADICNGSGACSNIIAADKCVIAATCYASGAVGPSACQLCTPGTSQTAWSPAAEGSSCTGGNVCSAGGACVPNIFFTEINMNPSTTCDSTGELKSEWVELYNASTAAIDVSGWKIQNANNSNAATIPSGSTPVPAKSHVVVCIKASGQASMATGIPCGLTATSVASALLNNSGTSPSPSFKLQNAALTTIDQVTWTASTDGVSWALSPCHYGMGTNGTVSTGTYWCQPSTFYGCPTSSTGDKGSPGAMNAACAGDTCLCNNGVLDADETCEDGNLLSGDGCSSACVDEVAGSVCGNAVLEAGEACDDGPSKYVDGDGCDTSCALEAGWMCTGVPTVCHSYDHDSEIVDPDADQFMWGAYLSSLSAGDEFVYAFQVADWGTSDGTATTLSSLTIRPGASNDAQWTKTLALAYLVDESANQVGGDATITDTALTFTGIDYVLPDGSFAHLYLVITLQSGGTLVDGSTLSFQINGATDATAEVGGSTFATMGTTPVESDDFIVSVDATALNVVSQPTATIAGGHFTLSYTATDVLGNLDLDLDQNVTLSLASGTGTLASEAGLTKPITAGAVAWTDLTYDKGESFTVRATASGGLSVTTSSITNAETSTLDISGYIVRKAASATEAFTIPAGTVLQPGDYVVIARYRDQADFETFWLGSGQHMGTNVHFFRASPSNSALFPVVNSTAKQYEIANGATIVDGPSVALAQYIDNVRVNLTANGSLAAHWDTTHPVSSPTLPGEASPGSGLTATNTGRLVISEVADARDSGTAYYNEFVELFYDGTDVCPDADKTDCVKPRFVGASCEAGAGTGMVPFGTACAEGYCDGAGACVFSATGGVVITEVMANPAACPGAGGEASAEWIEVQNVRSQAVTLDAWTLEEISGSNTYSFTFPAATTLAAGARMVLCPGVGGTSTLGLKSAGGKCDIVGLGFAVVNTASTLRLKTAGGVLDDSVTFGAATSGKSVALSPCHVSAADNDYSGYWTTAVDAYTCPAGGGSDFGTPGDANPPTATDTCFSCNNPLTDCPAQTAAGDCHKAVCVASGADWVCASAVDDADVQDDGLACTADLCTNGVASHDSTAGLPCKTDALLASNDGWCTVAGACNANTCGDTYKFSDESCDDGANGNADDGCRDDCSFTCATLGAACADAIADDCTFPKCAVGGNGQRCESGAGTGLVAQGTGCAGGGQCDASGNCAVPASAGDVIVTEIAMNPTACDTVGSDGAGEWFEIKNVSSHAVNLVGWTVADNEATYAVPTAYTLLPGALAVFCNDAVKPAWCTFSYGAAALRLGNGGDKLTLKDGFGTTIDEVAEFTASWPASVTSPVTGVSLALDPSRETSARNDLGWSWCAGQGTMACGDTGSPGTANLACAGGLIVPADAAHSTVRATNNVAADGHSHAIVSVELKASDDTPAYNRSLTFLLADASAGIVDPTGGAGTVTTDDEGRAVVYVTDSQAETISVSITDNGPAPKVALTGPNVTFVAPIGSTSATVNGVGLSVSGGTFTQAAAYDPSAMPPGLPEGVVQPYGVLATTITVALGGQATVTYTLPARVVQSYRLYKFGSETAGAAPAWYDISKNANVTNFKDPNTVFTVKLTDGGFGDADGAANGVIVDPTSIVQDPSAIPTLGEWAVLLLALLLMAVAVRRLRPAVRAAR
jgi:cysteine-rich repeat protein